MGASSGRAVRWKRYLNGPLARRWARLKASPGFVFARAFVLWFALIEFTVAFFALDGASAQAATAAAVAATSPLLGLEGAREGALVTFDGAFTYSVEPGCTGVSVAGMLLAAVLAYPTGLRRRLAGVAFCLPFTFGVNLLRLDTMAWLGVHAPDAFHVMHQLGWEAGVVLIGAAGFTAWVRVVETLDHGPSALPSPRTVLTACALFTLLFVGGLGAGVLAGADAHLGRALVAAGVPVGRALWGDAYPPAGIDAALEPVIFLTAMVGYASLFLATPGVPARRRAAAALWGAAVPVSAGGAVAALMQGGARLGRVEHHPLSVALFLLAGLGLPMLAWTLWSARLRREKRARDARAPPRAGAPHPASRAR